MTDVELLESIVFNAVAKTKQENYEIETQEDDDLAAGTYLWQYCVNAFPLSLACVCNIFYCIWENIRQFLCGSVAVSL